MPPARRSCAVSRAGVPLARAGERAGLEDAVAGPPVEPVEGGWIVRRPAADATLVAFVSDAPLRARRQAFWAAAAVLGAVILAAASLVVWYAARTLTVPIRSLGRAADRIASGDLTAAPASVTRDEMGQLAADFRRMAQGLTGLVQDVQAATRSVHEGAREMGEIGERVRGGALEEHDRVVAVNAAVEAMQDSVVARRPRHRGALRVRVHDELGRRRDGGGARGGPPPGRRTSCGPSTRRAPTSRSSRTPAGARRRSSRP